MGRMKDPLNLINNALNQGNKSSELAWIMGEYLSQVNIIIYSQPRGVGMWLLELKKRLILVKKKKGINEEDKKTK